MGCELHIAVSQVRLARRLQDVDGVETAVAGAVAEGGLEHANASKRGGRTAEQPAKHLAS
jgi:hypothetical protein